MFKKFCAHFCTPDMGLVFLRIALGIFIIHGWGKFSNMEQTIGFFGSLGLAPFWAYVVATVELLGGIAILLGVYARYAGALLAVIMVVAMAQTSWEMGFMPHAYEFVLLFASLAISAMGSGKFSVLKSSCCGCDCKDGSCSCETTKTEAPQA